jgi:hypothetical protein
MNKFPLLLLIILVVNHGSYAQLDNSLKLSKSLETEDKDTTAWMRGGLFNIGLNEGFLHNWPAGGEAASVVVNTLFSGYINRITPRGAWTNNLDVTYGMFYSYSNKFIPRKTDDRIDLTSKYGYKLKPGKKIYLTTLFNFKSQFTKGYDYSIPNWQLSPASEFLSPAYFILALGLEYRRDRTSLFFSPAAARLTIADSYYTSLYPEGAFGIENGKTSRFELGAYFSGRYETDPKKKLYYKTRLDLYSNYLAKAKTDSTGAVIKEDSPGNIDMLWDNLLLISVSKYLTVNFGVTMIYDNDIPYKDSYIDDAGNVVKKDEPGQALGWWQVKQLFTIGFKYKF